MTGNGDGDTVFHWLVLTFNGIILFTALALVEEGKKFRPLVLQVLALPILYFFALLNTEGQDTYGIIYLLENGLVFFGGLGLLFVSPFVFSSQNRGLWQFMLQLFIDAIVALAVGLALGAGLSIALISVENLFALYSLGNEEMQAIWAVSMIFVTSLVFFTQLPKDFAHFEKEAIVAENGLKKAIHFFNFPMLGLYGLILLAYLAKIAWTWAWPEGMLALPVLVFSLLGFFTYALAFAFKNSKDAYGFAFFIRFFPWTILALMPIYFMALWQRIAEYGVTENRYLGISVGLVLVFWALYFGLSKKQYLKLFPLSIFAVAFFIAFGPWGVSSVSEKSQVSRLEKILLENGLLVDGKLQSKSPGEVPDKNRTEISAILTYLDQNHGEDAIKSWLPESLLNSGVTGIYPGSIMKVMGLDIYYSTYFDSDHLYFSRESIPYVEVTGFDYVVDVHSDYFDLVGEADIFIDLSLDSGNNSLNFSFGGESMGVSLDPLLEKFGSFSTSIANVTEELMTLEIEGETFRAKLLLDNIDALKLDEGQKQVTHFYGQLLLDVK